MQPPQQPIKVVGKVEDRRAPDQVIATAKIITIQIPANDPKALFQPGANNILLGHCCSFGKVENYTVQIR
ncbi:hypothetical protein D3C80_2075650 [compost metagenome]